MSSTSEPSSLLSSPSDREFLLEDEHWEGGPLHCQWGQIARTIVYECLNSTSANEGFGDSFTCSSSSSADLATGSLGTCAYLQYELSKHCDKEEHRLLLLESARDFCLKVLRKNEANPQTDDEACEQSPESISILTNTEIGAHLLLTVIYNEMDQAIEGRDHLRILLRIWKERLDTDCEVNRSSNNDSIANSLWYGRAGALQGIYFLRRELYSPLGAEDLVVDIAKAIMQSIFQDGTLKNSAGIDGMMLGRIGALYTLLGMEEQEWSLLQKEMPGCQRAIQEFIENNYLLPPPADGRDSSWATGITGQILLLLRASQVFHKDSYFTSARSLAKQYLLRKYSKPNIELGNGFVGVAFAFRYLGEDRAAERLVQLATSNLSEIVVDVKQYGVFDGLAGLALLLTDMADRILPPSFPFLHPPASSIFQSASKPSRETSFEESESPRAPEAHTNPSPPRIFTSPRTPFSTPARESKIPKFSTPSSTSVRSQQSHISPSPTLKAALKPTKIPTPIKSNSVSSQLLRERRIRTPQRPTTKSKENHKTDHLSPIETQTNEHSSSILIDQVQPSSPPRTIRLGTEYRVISEYQFQDRNGKLARRIMSRCLENTTAEGNLLTGGIGPCIYLRLQMSNVSVNNRTQLLKAAMVEAVNALKLAKKRTGAFSPNIFADEYVGTKCLYVAILHRLGRTDEAIENANGLLQILQNGCTSLPSEACDLLDGRAGVLKTIWFLRSELESPQFGRNLALDLSKQILIQGMMTAQKYNSESLLMWEWKGKPYLGAAHGVVGILHTLLGHSEEEMMMLESMLPRVKDVILQAIESLHNCCDVSGNLRKKLNDEEQTEDANMVHGSPGYCLLLSKASIIFPAKRKEFFSRAMRLADVTLRSPRINNPNGGLMRGVSGIGYIFLALSQLDLDNRSKWVSKAENVAHDAVDKLDSLIPNSRRPYSLFEGIGGLALLLFDLMHPERAWFPFYDAR